MRNLCVGDHCVRAALESDGYIRKENGDLVKKPTPFDTLPDDYETGDY